MPMQPTEHDDATPPDDGWTMPEPEVVNVPADLPVLEPSHVISLPLNEAITSAVVVPDEHEGSDVLYVAVSQERVNVWAAVVYFVPEIALGVTGVLVLVALRKWWVGRRFLHRKGEAYCKKCWAGLTGVESDTCPECGRRVAKTKRIAKRSPLSPRWVWPAAALLALLGSAAIWFGEGWHTAWRYGFDLSDRYTRRELYNYADRDSVFRINPMAGWLHWPSAKLAALGRNHDHPWIEALDDAYSENEGTHNFLAIRRYATIDGQLLSTSALPESSQWQNSHLLGGAYLGEVNGVVLVTDGDHYYRLRHGKSEPWLMFVTEDPAAHRTIASSTLDGRYIIIGFSDGNPHNYHAADTQQLLAFDTETGDAIASLHLFDSEQDKPPTASNPPPIEPDSTRVNLDGRQSLGGIAMLTDRQQVLLYIRHATGNTQHPRILYWNFVQNTLTESDTPASAAIPLDQAFIAPYPWSIQSINQFSDYWGGNTTRYSDYSAVKIDSGIG